MTVHVCGGNMTVYAHMSGGYMTVHVCVVAK